jgi:hypothetical protein
MLIIENNMTPQKLKIGIPYDPQISLLDIYPKDVSLVY